MLSAVSRAETSPPRSRLEELLVPDRVGVLELELAGRARRRSRSRRTAARTRRASRRAACRPSRSAAARAARARGSPRRSPLPATLSRGRARSSKLRDSAAAIRSSAHSGRSWPMPSITTSSAPGIAAAVASPPETSISASSAPWTTTVGVRSRRSSAVRSGDATIAAELARGALRVVAAVERPPGELPRPPLVERPGADHLTGPHGALDVAIPVERRRGHQHGHRRRGRVADTSGRRWST